MIITYKEKFLDYSKAVEAIIERQRAGENWHMEIEIIESIKFYILIRED